MMFEVLGVVWVILFVVCSLFLCLNVWCVIWVVWLELDLFEFQWCLLCYFVFSCVVVVLVLLLFVMVLCEYNDVVGLFNSDVLFSLMLLYLVMVLLILVVVGWWCM